MVHFTQCLFHLYNEDSYNYNEDFFILYICILYVYICTTSVLQINVAIVTFDAHRWCVQLSFLSEGGALFSIGGASNKVTINVALVI